VRRWLEPAGLAIVVLGQFALFSRLLHTAYDYDEGVYLLSLDALRSGQELGTEVFAAQPPSFYWLLRGIAAVLGDQPDRVRMGVIVLSGIGTIGAWALARSIAGPLAGVLAAALIVISPPIPLFAARVLADLPSLWFSLAALGLAATARRRALVVAAAASGVMSTVAVTTKVSAMPVVILVAIVLLRTDAPRRALAYAAGGAIVAAAALLAAHFGALADLWSEVVTYHDLARSTPAVINRWASIGDLFNPRTPILWVVVAAVFAFGARLARRRTSIAEIALWVWALCSFLFLTWHAPLHYNHLVALPVPLALAAAISLAAQLRELPQPARIAGIAALGVVVAAGFGQQWRRLDIAVEPQQPFELAAAAKLRTVTRREDFVATDVPMAVVLAHRVAPGPLVDTAYLRFQTGSLTSRSVLAVIDEWCVEAVVAGRSFTRQPAIMSGLRIRYRRESKASGVTVFYRPRDRCATHRTAG
jgi:4-amino-4-deoxy-L-arabinose transferase-like glycosyltransferase